MSTQSKMQTSKNGCILRDDFEMKRNLNFIIVFKYN